jgi:hypothetical protein
MNPSVGKLMSLFASFASLISSFPSEESAEKTTTQSGRRAKTCHASVLVKSFASFLEA